MINAKREFIVQKRSKNKDYCPSYIDLAAGGVVGIEDTNVDENAAREVEEELGIPYTNHTKPTYLFKFSYSDMSTSCWCYVYYLLWNGAVKPQETEVDALFYW